MEDNRSKKEAKTLGEVGQIGSRMGGRRGQKVEEGQNYEVGLGESGGVKK